MRQFPGLAIHFLMQIVMLLPAAGLLSWVGERCCLEALSLNSAAGNGKIQRVLAITYSVPEFVLLFLFCLFPVSDLKISMGKHGR